MTQSAWAAATTKTVTYTITDIEQGNNTTTVTFTRYGDSFDTSQSTYTTHINNSTLGNNGSTGYVSVQFADGFELNMSWSAGSNVRYTNNCFYPSASEKKITYSISCKDDNYYVTNLKLKGFESNDPWTNTNIAINQQWRFIYSVTDGHSLGSVTFTYTDTPSLSIFESPGVNTYNIKTTADLRHLANYVNHGGNNCYGLTFLQTQDISYTHTTAWNDASSTEHNHTAIGTGDHVFCGIYDGQDYTISGIRIYQPDFSYQGLFGSTGTVNKGGTIKRVNLADARITGHNNVGGIAGYIFQTTVEDCTVATDVCIHGETLNSNFHGGIVGQCHDVTVQRCISHVTLTNNNSSEFYGAIAGEVTGSKGKVKDCIAIGATVPNVGKRGVIAGHISDFSPERNYYYNCTVAGVANATGVGVGYDSSGSYPHDVTTNQGAQALYSLTLPSGVTLERTASATLPGTGNKTYTTGADIDGTPYAYSGATLTLGYSGNVPAYHEVVYRVNGTAISGNTFTMPTADVTISATLTPSASIALAANAHEENYWTTFYFSEAGYKIDDAENACAYTAEYDGTNSQLTLHALGKVIPAGTAVIIVGEDNSISMTASTETVSNMPDNDLRGLDIATALTSVKTTYNAENIYVMGNTTANGFGFHRYTGTNVPANKAFLPLPSSTNAPTRMVFDDMTGIESIHNSQCIMHNKIYDLQGRCVGDADSPLTLKKGVYIVNGRKVIRL